MKIGRFLNVLAMNSELLIDKVRELGIQGWCSFFGVPSNVLCSNMTWILISNIWEKSAKVCKYDLNAGGNTLGNHL